MSASDLNELRLVSAGHRHDAEVTINNAVFAELIVRASTAERRNKGILAELSASGGRNIDLRQRAETAVELAAETTELNDSLAAILLATANALKGEPGPLADHSWHDLAEVATALNARAEAAEAKVAAGISLGDRALHSWHAVQPFPDNSSWEVSNGRGLLAEEMLAALDGDGA